MTSNSLLIYYNWFRGGTLFSFGVMAQLMGPKKALKFAGIQLGDFPGSAKKKKDDDIKEASSSLEWVDKLAVAITARDVGLSLVHFAAAWMEDPTLGKVAAATTAAEILGILWGIPEAIPSFVPILVLDVVAMIWA